MSMDIQLTTGSNPVFRKPGLDLVVKCRLTSDKPPVLVTFFFLEFFSFKNLNSDATSSHKWISF
jgi:hypothetical protein